MTNKTTTITFDNPAGGIKYIFQWSDKLWAPSNEIDIFIDFKNLTFPKPFEVIFIINQIDAYKKTFPSARLHFINYINNSKILRTGLSNYIDTALNNKEDDSYNDIDYTYLPVRRLTLSEFRGKDIHPRDTNDIIEINSGKLAERLTQRSSGYVFDVTQYSLREIIRNIYEHSGSVDFLYCAQYFHSSNIAEICISDTGIGIHASLTRNPKFSNLSPRDSIHWACLPGVSGNAQAFLALDSTNPWRNSGYGLYMMSRLCKNNGDFLIISNNLALYMQNSKNIFQANHSRGTTIRLHLNLQHAWSLRDQLEKYAKDGKEIAKDIVGAAQIDASTASMMLRRDFDMTK